jgi:hypothetical protein
MITIELNNFELEEINVEDKFIDLASTTDKGTVFCRVKFDYELDYVWVEVAEGGEVVNSGYNEEIANFRVLECDFWVASGDLIPLNNFTVDKKTMEFLEKCLDWELQRLA